MSSEKTALYVAFWYCLFQLIQEDIYIYYVYLAYEVGEFYQSTNEHFILYFIRITSHFESKY